MTSRSKFRQQIEVCGDCDATDPSWASINRGILLCSDCCSMHRSLGRHVSIVKSLRQGHWLPTVLSFVRTMSQTANSIWEHSLLETSGANNKNIKKKPTPKDPLHPNKSDFVKMKHCNLQFVLKPNTHYDIATGDAELSKQLHASVRSGILETSLRLLVQGADPNYFHEEKRSTPLHVAAKFGQASQCELLIVYGACINVVDGNGQTPIEVAQNNNHNAIAERLIEAMYEVTDRLIVFLGGKKPDHSSGKHLNIPERQQNIDITEQLKIARGKLQLIPNKMFEELVMDLYDEVDRRENEAIWLTSSLNPDSGAVPFLPLNPFLSATRNQGRQKLARFSPIQFAGLLTDVLLDARRRQNMANLRPIDPSPTRKLKHQDSNFSDDEPLYDDVADDDYAALTPLMQHKSFIASNQNAAPSKSNPIVDDLRKQLIYYMSEVNELKSVVHQLSAENTHLKAKFSESPQHESYQNIYDVPLRVEMNENKSFDNIQQQQQQQQPEDENSNQIGNSNNQLKRPASMYETRPMNNTVKNPIELINRTATSMYQIGVGSTNLSTQQNNNNNIDNNGNESQIISKSNINFADDVRCRIDVITKRLKELCVAMQDIQNKNNTFVPCAERIKSAVGELLFLFPPENCSNETISLAIKQLNVYTNLMQKECENLAKSIQTSDNPAIEAFIQEVRDCALHLASATKTLVIQFQ